MFAFACAPEPGYWNCNSAIASTPPLSREADAGGILLLRIARVVVDRAAVEDACQHRDVVIDMRAGANPQRRKRIGGAAAGQVLRGQDRPTKRGVDEIVRVLD